MVSPKMTTVTKAVTSYRVMLRPPVDVNSLEVEVSLCINLGRFDVSEDLSRY